MQPWLADLFGLFILLGYLCIHSPQTGRIHNSSLSTARAFTAEERAMEISPRPICMSPLHHPGEHRDYSYRSITYQTTGLDDLVKINQRLLDISVIRSAQWDRAVSRGEKVYFVIFKHSYRLFISLLRRRS